MVSHFQLFRVQPPSNGNNCFGNSSILQKYPKAEIMEKVRPGEFRWYGFLLPEEYDEQGRLLYQVIDPMVANEPVRERPARN